MNQNRIRDYLEGIKASSDEVRRFADPNVYEDPEENFNGLYYSPELGWLRKDTTRIDGFDGSRTYFTYEDNGARAYSRFPGEGKRILTFGDSFTHCDQVSDGETWQEYLANHFHEPVLNFGVGGYSVYQAYLRYGLVRKKMEVPYVILNIWEDDHFRNLDSWRAIRIGSRPPGAWPLPHLVVSPDLKTVTPKPNCCQTVGELERMCDIEYLMDQFGDDSILRLVLATKSKNPPDWMEATLSLGLPEAKNEGKESLIDWHRQAALSASRWVVAQLREICAAQGQKLMVITSYPGSSIRRVLEGEERWDLGFLDWLSEEKITHVDVLSAYHQAWSESRLEPSTFLSTYFNGHHSPYGNFFMAEALREPLLEWLDPTPPAYRDLSTSR